MYIISECPTGTFGSDCGYNCSGNCLGDVTCNTTTGRCDPGCKPGYTGELCDTGLRKYNVVLIIFIFELKKTI